MLVSVVIPAYNAEQWISETIKSVLKQTYKDIEIVVVDDGSTDHTVEVAMNSLEGTSIPYRILSQSNAGAASARNRGWQAARAQWIQFLDADDLLAPQKIELQVNFSGGKRADVIYSNWQKLIWKDESWKANDIRTPVIHADALPDILSDRNFLQLGSLLFRTSILNNVGGFDSSHEPIEDVGLCVKIAICGGVFLHAPSAEPIASYRDLPRSFSKINHRRFIESCMKNAKLAEQYVRQHQTNGAKTIGAIVDVYYTGARFYAGLDWKRFDEIVADIESLRPNFVPHLPARIKILSRIFGYRKAERLAVLYRRGKSIGKKSWRAYGHR